MFHSLGFKGKAIQGQHRQKRNGMEGYTFGLGGVVLGASKQANKAGRQAGGWHPRNNRKEKKRTLYIIEMDDSPI